MAMIKDIQEEDQEYGNYEMQGYQSIAIGKPAPDFRAKAVMSNGEVKNDFHLKDYLKGSYGIVFFYPRDFTFVCPTEILAFSHRASEFEAKNAKIVGVSTDSVFVHSAWRSVPLEKGGLGSDIAFPLVADTNHSISADYGVLIEEEGMALRGTFLVDKNMILHQITVNNGPLGRNVDEVLRLVDALQHFEKHGEVCPAGWKKGQEAMKPNADGVSSYLSKHGKDV